MENYDAYKEARDLAWRVILECGIKELPVDLKVIADTYGTEIISYKKAVDDGRLSPEKAKGRFIIASVNGKRTIYINNSLKDRGSVRFSIAMGIGACLISKTPWVWDERTNYMAGIFARDLLMPAIVLFSINALDAEAIREVSQVSMKAAEIRAERMAELVARNRFNTSRLEEKVKEQFKDYIEKRG